MKIGKYTKLKDNRYSVMFDDIKVKLYDDVIVKFELLRMKSVDDKLFQEIVDYNDSLEAYYKSLKYISRKMRTEKEIYLYLEKDYKKSVVFDTISRLKKDGYINKDLYLKSYLLDQINLKEYGPNKIKDQLIKLGYLEEEIKDKIDEIDDSIWLDKIDKIIKRKIRTNRNYGNNKLKEKILYDLSNQGFYKWMIEEGINNSTFTNNDDILEREYKKVYCKLSKKYDGSNLNFQVKMKLIQKGFYSEEIDNYINRV